MRTGWVFEADMLKIDVALDICQGGTFFATGINLGFSKIENMETEESFALAESEAIAFVRDTPIMAKTKAK